MVLLIWCLCGACARGPGRSPTRNLRAKMLVSNRSTECKAIAAACLWSACTRFRSSRCPAHVALLRAATQHEVTVQTPRDRGCAEPARGPAAREEQACVM